MKELFIKSLGQVKGEHLYGEYTSVRNAMEGDNFFREIKGKESFLSDHSEKHIQDVFERAYKVIGEDEFQNLNAYNIYCLALMILFHDVGNIFGRKGHNAIEKIAEIYNKYRSNFQNYRDEKRVITHGASAHCGKSKSGNNDTLKDLNSASIKGQKINLCEIAAILRFSDELAEGKQRTCSLLIEKGMLDDEKGSEIYHKYAQVSDIEIDRNLQRISITYDINIPGDFDQKAQKDFKDLLNFTYYRAVKLDTERRYNKYYSTVLKQFKFVSVQYNFSIDEIPIEIDLNKITFEDRYPIPGEKEEESIQGAEKYFINMDNNYELSKIIENINSKIKK
ncbi:MAG: hypothetical protein H0V01_10715 [Bacteroidetes bacterium]|nr:hypothetical protein [Bacteroidota bacterium]HET6244824.1 hypothetical protein [Bacteroidia bacterium]